MTRIRKGYTTAEHLSRATDTLRTLELAATALAEIGTGDHRDGILTRYREAGGALGGIAEAFIAARRDARDILGHSDEQPPQPSCKPDENPAYRAAMIDAGRGRQLR